MSPTRREVLQLGSAALAALALDPALAFSASTKKKVLILGGTNFVGPQLVAACQARGWEVTLFNRGKTNKGLFPNVRTIEGNRFPDRAPGLDGLKTEEKWDAVIDTWSGPPGAVKATAELLKDRVRTYAYISTISVYRDFDKVGLDEEYRKFDVPADLNPFAPDTSYMVAKRAAEVYIGQAFKDGAANFRPSLIMGADPSHSPQNQRLYWPMRIRRGGEVLVPDSTSAVQYTDAADLAEFVVHCIAQGTSGDFNVMSTPGSLNFKQYIETLNSTAKSDAKLTWVSEQFLEQEEVGPMGDLPVWLPSDNDTGFLKVSNAKALKAGLKLRPFTDTAKDIFESFAGVEVTPEKIPGIKPEREAELLKKWHSKSAG